MPTQHSGHSWTGKPRTRYDSSILPGTEGYFKIFVLLLPSTYCPRRVQALSDARRLIRHHPEVVAERVLLLVSAVAPAVDALRSQTALNAMVLLQVTPSPACDSCLLTLWIFGKHSA
jgi:hypothetical protein